MPLVSQVFINNSITPKTPDDFNESSESIAFPFPVIVELILYIIITFSKRFLLRCGTESLGRPKGPYPS